MLPKHVKTWLVQTGLMVVLLLTTITLTLILKHVILGLKDDIPNPEEILDEGIFYIVYFYMMLLLYDAFVIKEFERAYDKECDDPLSSMFYFTAYRECSMWSHFFFSPVYLKFTHQHKLTQQLST